ncbi:DUF308 domain-containing protein [Candidatus Saccharibacteria bacterium]|nr:DUF308 domain-containing protein [Candidatus Saccharibacteria bacterium]
MAHINRRFIDKHWLIFIIRGVLAGVFGLIALFGGMVNVESMIAIISLFLLFMGIIDSASALYNSTKKRGWVNSIIDAFIDVAAALLLLFCSQGNIVFGLIILSVYTILSGVIDIFHGFLSTADPTDRFIRILAGVCGCIIGVVIINAGEFEVTTFIRFFGAYMLIVGVTSMIYGVHNRSQDIEDKTARKEARTKSPKKPKNRRK